MLKESSYGKNTYTGVTANTPYSLWDENKNTMCFCDPGFDGIDCSLRLCPRGDDPLTWEPYTCGTSECRNEKQSFSVDGNQAAGAYFLTFTDQQGWEWKSSTFLLNTKAYSAAAAAANTAAIKAALEGLPNGAAGTVTVTQQASSGGAAASEQARFTVEFLTVTGLVPAMKLGFDTKVEPTTGSSFVFQPALPVQVFNFTDTRTTAEATASIKYYIQFQIFPTDQTKYGLAAYWQSTLVKLGTVTDDLPTSTQVAAALNTIPAIKLDFGAPFKADSNVVSTKTGSTMTSKIAFPSDTVGFNAIKYRVYKGTDATPPTVLSTDAWSTVTITDRDNIHGNKEAAVCSNRGICDFATGLCNCFAGQTGSDCSQQSALARGATSAASA